MTEQPPGTCAEQTPLPSSRTGETPAMPPVAETPPMSSLPMPALMPAPAEATVPTHYGRYAWLRDHAQGGLGKVSLAQDTKLGRTVALKEIRPDRRPSPEALQRFVNEAAITGLLEHPGIVPIYSLDEDDAGRPYYAMRFIEGQSLKAAIETHHARPDAGSFRRLLQQFIAVCNAVAFAHSKGVIHRDLKPDNVMLGDFGETLVVDWGLAKRLDGQGVLQGKEEKAKEVSASFSGEALTQAGAVMGTPGYMSPEQARGETEQLGTTSDLYALGGILYCILTGGPPFAGNVFDILQNQQQGKLPGLPTMVKPGVPKALEAICLKAMASRPEERYPTASTLAADAERWLADEPTIVYAEPWTTRARRWLKRHRTLAVSAVLLLLAVATIAVIAAVMSEQLRTKVEAEQQRTALERHQAILARDEERRANERGQEVIETLVSDAQLRLLERLPALSEDQEKLLRSLVAYYRDYLKTAATTAQEQARRVQTYLRLGEMQRRLGLPEEALASFREARQLAQRLAEQTPSDTDKQVMLALAAYYVGHMEYITGRMAEAEASLKASIDVQEALCAQAPNDTRVLRDLARSWRAMATLQTKASRYDQAATGHRRASELVRRAKALQPGHVSLRNELAAALHDEGVFLILRGQLPQARLLVEEAQRLLAALVADQPGEYAYAHDLAVTWNTLGQLKERQGQRLSALGDYRQALTLWEKLAAAHPSVPDCKSAVARTSCNMASVLNAAGNTQEAMRQLEVARDTWAKLSSTQPTVEGHKTDLAAVWNMMGHVRRNEGRSDLAASCYRHALEVEEEVIRVHGLTPGCRTYLVPTLTNLAELDIAAGRAAAAEQHCRHGLELLAKLDRPARAVFETRQAEVSLSICLGEALSGQGHREEALTHFQQAFTHLTALRQQAPKVHSVVQALEDAHRARARTLHDLGRFSEALQDWDESLRLARATDPLGLCELQQLGRAETLAAMDDHVRSVQQLKWLASGLMLSRDGTPAEIAQAQVKMAKVYARCVLAAGKATNMDSLKLQQQYVNQAISLLRQAKVKGHFQERRQVETLQADPGFSPLRDTEPYKAFLQELAKGT